MSADRTMKMGEVERPMGFKTPVIRFYERKGLLPSPEWNWRSYRLFTQAHMSELILIKLLVGLGFKVEKIKRLWLALSTSPPRNDPTRSL